MNTTALKAFAPDVRRKLHEAIDRKLDVVLAAATPDYRTTYASQVAALREQARANRTALVERVAYTWFNRLAALRYLDARGWHPFAARVLTAPDASATQPELLRQVREGALPEPLRRHTDPARLNDLLDGRLPSANPQQEVQRALVLAACRYYHALLPDLFERLDDATELLLPDDLLTEQSPVAGFRTAITDADCADVEVLGWLYQFYISEKKDAVMARKSAVPAEDIPAVTQLFTPHWIVRYLVENSLGRLWLLNRPGSRLRERMPYYVETEPETDFLRVAGPEELRVLDPAVGSGHMLTYAFDLLHAIYEEEGYAPSEIPGLILGHNLYGIDIDPRAAQLAQLALVLKAREKARRFFQPDVLVQPHVIALQDVTFVPGEIEQYVRELKLGPLFDGPVRELLGQFGQATTLGSLIQPVLGATALADLRRAIEQADVDGQLMLTVTHAKVRTVLAQAEYLALSSHVVIANPPYMGFKQLNADLKQLASEAYPKGSADLYAMFVQRNVRFAKPSGRIAMLTMDSWMYGAGYTVLREWLCTRVTVKSLVHLGPRAFETIAGEVVQVAGFVFENASRPASLGIYHRLVELPTAGAKESAFLRGEGRFSAPLTRFAAVPRCIFAYQASDDMVAAFTSGEPLSSLAEAFTGLQTGDNPRFIRYWYEVDYARIQFGCASRKEAEASRAKWFPYVKGSDYRKWYGNNICVVNWANDGAEIRKHPSSSVSNTEHFFGAGLAYNNISKNFCVRANEPGFIYDQKNSKFVATSESDAQIALALLNSRAIKPFLDLLTPKDYNPGSMKIIPFPKHLRGETRLREMVVDLVSIAKANWSEREYSWDFAANPLILHATRDCALALAWKHHQELSIATRERVQFLETSCNALILSAYGMAEEVSSHVGQEEVTLSVVDEVGAARDLVSYAIGCMMGRYSLDHSGLILANAGATLADYETKVGKPLDALTFAPDADGIIPVLDGEWFEDDVVARTREFLRATFGDATLRANVRWLEESLGKELRKYFLVDFYKDHLQTYKKRPIYWLVQSPKKGFACLIYLHRYTRDTLNVVLNRYLREYQGKLRSRLAQLDLQLAADTLPARDRTVARREQERLTKVLHECEEWERQVLLPLAQQRIELDLDDGVKVNYQKLGAVLAPIPGLAAAEE